MRCAYCGYDQGHVTEGCPRVQEHHDREKRMRLEDGAKMWLCEQLEMMRRGNEQMASDAPEYGMRATVIQKLLDLPAVDSFLST